MANTNDSHIAGVEERALRLGVQIPKVGQNIRAPDVCPHCRGIRLHRHQQCERHIVDLREAKTRTDRFSCLGCGRTFRKYADGVSRSRQSESIRVLSILLYALGLGHSHISRVFEMLGYFVSRTSVFRNVQTASPEVRALHESKQKRAVRVVGNDRELGRSGRKGIALNLLITAVAQELELTAQDTPDERAFVADFVAVAEKMGCSVTFKN